MEDKYIDGKTRFSRDDDISRVAEKAKTKELGGKPMVTAIQNESGEVYRIITVSGLGAYMAIAMGITALGLVDLHADNLNPGKYDSLFATRK